MRPFILARYIWREHLGPFFFSFALITLIFLLDLVFRHLSRILSKGLPMAVLFEFFGLNLAWIVATAVPMAVLTATLMAFGRLAADQEITAMQASGISLWRMITPIIMAAGVLALGLIWFNNHILPDFNYRARLLATDITRKKPGVKIEPGVWFRDISRYSLLVQALEDSNTFSKVYGLIIDDNTDADLQRTIAAHSGRLEMRSADNRLLLTLFDGEIQEINIKKLEEFRRVKFVKHSMSLPVDDGMFWQRHEAATRTDREKSVVQMWQDVQKHRADVAQLAQRINLLVGLDFYQHVHLTFGLLADSLAEVLHTPQRPQSLLGQQKQRLAQLDNLVVELQHSAHSAQTLLVEIHKKYAIPAACLVFVLIGAPLGVLARRGGLTTGVSLSLGFFLLYWIFLIGGEDLADRQIVSPFVAMWSANFLIGGAAIYVFRRIASGRVAPVALHLPNLLRRIRRRQFNRDPRRLAEQQSPNRPQEIAAVGPTIPAAMTEHSQPAAVEPPAPEPQPAAPPAKQSHVSLLQLELTPVPEILRHFTNRTRASLVFLIDGRGVPLAYCKNPAVTLPPGADLAVLARLAASQIAATEALGKSLGADDHFFSNFHEGERCSVFSLQINHDFILLVIFDKTVRLGAIHLHAHEARTNLQKILL